ncbi:MAG: hypothetical protein PHI99_11755, partial [Syntrophales bacterium]|nr:hypothetical protein [Syntrophales bacterium]
KAPLWIGARIFTDRNALLVSRWVRSAALLQGYPIYPIAVSPARSAANPKWHSLFFSVRYRCVDDLPVYKRPHEGSGIMRLRLSVIETNGTTNEGR